LVVLVCLLAGCDIVLGLDKPPVDGAAFDPSQCPAGYDAIAPGIASKYRFETLLAGGYLTQRDRCLLDSKGLTHLAVIEKPTESQAILDAMKAKTIDNAWVGLTQRADAVLVTEGWTWITGEPLDPMMWVTNEPDDMTNGADKHIEDFGMTTRFDIVGTLLDAPGNNALPAICECDGIDLR
jgi:hypothetical protein